MKNTSTLTFRRLRALALAGVGLLTLAGCLQVPGGGGTAQREVTVSRSAVTIAGPSGFCVDTESLRNDQDSAFVLLGNCAAIAQTARYPQPEVRALLTAAVQETGGLSIKDQSAEVTAYLKTEDGRAMLSRAGRADSVAILDTRKSGDVLFLHALDKSPGYVPGMSAEQWRAIFDLEGTVISLTVIGFDDAPLTAEAGKAMVREFASVIRRENAGR
ncbi:hypothetical protein [Tropicimonas sp. S265A]|uniref:hypothetical protein n=1 Tax=Tropicimonas sp. S265A TaxID=3415134 RepID=UPI003C7A1926